MKKFINLTAGFLTCIFLFMLLTAYDHEKTHVGFNDAIVTKFLNDAKSTSFASGKFKNYEFNWNTSGAPQLEGPELAGDCYLSYSEVGEPLKKNTPAQWISKGGWMEDEPWGPAALRHFYDPLAIDGGKYYLTDNSSKIETMLSPIAYWYKMDAKSWTSSSENPYSWTKGKDYVLQALRTSDAKTRESLMAKAYRCLGQTLHLLADMGCPPHVRNDSHPPKFPLDNFSIIGDPDPYEQLCANLNVAEYSSQVSPNTNLKGWFESAHKYTVLFEKLASFTNSYFVTAQTISVNNFKQKIRPNNPYPQPSFSDADYNRTDHYFYKTLSGEQVKMFRDWKPVPLLAAVLSGSDSLRGAPYVDFACVKSQARVIFPNVVEAGKHLVRMFIPALEVEVTEAKADSGGIVRGKVKYSFSSPEDEYYSPIDINNIYNGDVAVYVNGNKLTKAATATKNNFEIKINNEVTLKKDDVIKAEIEFGGIKIKSADKKVGETSDLLKFIKTLKHFAIYFNVDCTFSNGERSCIFAGDGCQGFSSNNFKYENKTYSSISWSGNVFNLTHQYSNPPGYDAFSSTFSVTGRIADDGTIESLSYNYGDTSGWEYSFTIENVQISSIENNPAYPTSALVMYLSNQGSSDKNGTVKNFSAKEPNKGTATTVHMNTFSVQVWFAYKSSWE